MIKGNSASKALVIKINLICLALLFIVYIFLPSIEDASSHHKVEVETRPVRVDEKDTINIPNFFTEYFPKDLNIAIINIGEDDASMWRNLGHTTILSFDKVPVTLQWKDIFPEWIDEEEENEGATCPEIPMPETSSISGELDVVVAGIPCRRPEAGWARDVNRLQAHLAAAKIASEKGKRDHSKSSKVRVVLRDKCRPMMEIFRSEDLVKKEGDWWLYEVEGTRLQQKLAMPVGSCMLALPLWRQGTNVEIDHSKVAPPPNPRRRPEAFATVLHSSDVYVCGAVALAHSLRRSGSARDLVLLHDRTIRGAMLRSLAAAGWKLRQIKRIRNPHANHNAYNEYNYSKLRLWQLTDYFKVVFIDADILILRNVDFLFSLPELSAAGNDGVIFNSGVMVIEPSIETFNELMHRRSEIISYNGGDQGFLNEVFVWWHRIPRRLNYLKNFWANTTAEAAVKNQMFAADDPPAIYALHYLGLKPWLCYRDYDCNWNVKDQRVYASDVAHRRWWKIHDEMDPKVTTNVCRLKSQRKWNLMEQREKARELGYADKHWKIKITDPRQFQ